MEASKKQTQKMSQNAKDVTQAVNHAITIMQIHVFLVLMNHFISTKLKKVALLRINSTLILHHYKTLQHSFLNSTLFRINNLLFFLMI